MKELLFVTPLQALAVCITTIGMYVAMIILVRLVGQRMLAGLSSFDLAAMIAFGSIIGRASLSDFPRLGSGLVALVTLVVLQGLAGLLRRHARGHWIIATQPVLLMVGEQVVARHLKRCHVSPIELQAALRSAGIRHPDEVGVAIFESSGSISVLRRGRAIDPQLLSGVTGAALVPQEFLP